MSAYNLQKRLIEAISSRGNTIIWIGGLQNEESRNKYNAGGPSLVDVMLIFVYCSCRGMWVLRE